jgi:hypothetical protein
MLPSSKWPVAKQQAVAQVPVVKPVRRGCGCSLDSGHITQINLVAALALTLMLTSEVW